MKSDARVRYTRKVLRDSFLRILAEKHINDITVKEVCDMAEVNRATFYMHFKDCYDLLEQIEMELLGDYAKAMEQLKSQGTQRLTAAVFEMIEENQEICDLLIFQHKDDLIIQKMISIAHDASLSFWKSKFSNASDDDLEQLFTFLANGVMHVVIKGYSKYRKDYLINFVNMMVENTLESFMQNRNL